MLNFNETYYKAFLSDFDKRHKDIRFFVPFPFYKDFNNPIVCYTNKGLFYEQWQCAAHRRWKAKA